VNKNPLIRWSWWGPARFLLSSAPAAACLPPACMLFNSQLSNLLLVRAAWDSGLQLRTAAFAWHDGHSPDHAGVDICLLLN
jgi:hypothetical protein